MDNSNVPVLRFAEFDGDWEKKTISSVANKVTDGTHDTPKPVKSGFPYITAIHVKDGYINFDSCYFLTEKDHKKIIKRCNPEKGDLLMVNIGAGVATSSIINIDYEFSLKNVALIKPDRNIINPDFFSQIQRKNSAVLKHRLTSGGAQPFLSLKQIGKLKLTIANTLPEQKKIANFLSAVDSKIEQLGKKKALLEQYKKGAMQQLFASLRQSSGQATPKLRFYTEPVEAWEVKQLGDLTFKVGKKNKENIKYPIYSINNKQGFIPQSEQFEKMDSNDRGYDITLYKIIDNETFAYNPARINVGSIGYSYQLGRLIVSSLYVCFKTNEELEDPYLLHFLDTYQFNKSVIRNLEGGVREYLFYDNFSNIKIPLPCNNEQLKIANFLSSLDKKIEAVQKQIEQTEAFKKGLLQKMFV